MPDLPDLPDAPPLPGFALSLPSETLPAGTFLTLEGGRSGRVYVLESGKLTVLRAGVTLASIETRGALIGEMAVLLDSAHSASVRAESAVTVRVLDDATARFAEDPALALHVARVAVGRLNATSALLVELQRGARNRPGELALVERLLGALAGAGAPLPGRARRQRVDHE
jgi:CRP/FNR family transcriptional regulator, cyclic AMP receptor protein